MKYLKSADPGTGVITDGEELISPDENSSPEGNSTPDQDIANEIPNGKLQTYPKPLEIYIYIYVTYFL